MKKLFGAAFLAAMFAFLSFPAFADGYKISTHKFPDEFTTLTGTSAASGDYMPLWDASAGDWKKVDATNWAVLAGVTATATELNYNDITTLGTLQASKAWTSDASLDTVMPTGGLLTVQSGGAITLNSGSILTINGEMLLPNEDTTATNALAVSECGKVIYLNSATEFATTLPAPTAGCRFSFIVKAAPSGAAYTVATASTANILIGHVETADIDGAADGDSSTVDDTITFADGVAVVGDRVDMDSDGTSWYYIGHAKTYNGITAAAVD